MKRTGYNKKLMRIWYLLLLSWVACSLCNGQEGDAVNITATAAPTEIHVGDRVTFDIAIEWKGEIEIRSVQPELIAKGFEFLSMIVGRGIQQTDDHLGAFNVSQELVSQTLPRVRPFNQSRNVRQDKAAALRLQDPQVRPECRERIRANLRSRPG